MKALYLCDYSNFMYKMAHVFKMKREIHGVAYDVSILYGLMRSLKANSFKDIWICLDGNPEVSEALLGGYKGQRSKEPEEKLLLPKKRVIQFLTGYGKVIGKNIKVIASSGQEADQVIASSVFRVVQKDKDRSFEDMFRKSITDDWRLKNLVYDNYKTRELDFSEYDMVVVGTTDSDMQQLMEFDNVVIDTSTSGKNLNFGSKTAKAVHDIQPSSIVAYKAIVGDISDNVPGLTIKSFKRDDLIKLIDKELNSREKFHKFRDKVSKGINPYKGDIGILADEIIQTGQARIMNRNNTVTELTFVSSPVEIYYDNVDCKKLAAQYGLKI